MMNVDKELKNMSCIKNMQEGYFEKWEEIKNFYAPKLDEGSILRPIAFTYHDYSHHCYNIYKIISNTILRKPELTEQEWFLLDTAVLLHDYSMVQANFDRRNHSKQSAEWLLKEMEADTVLRANLNQSEAEAVSLIIEAHSDCKKLVNQEEKIARKTLENPSLEESMDCDGAGFVRVKFLAAVLRVADECDVTRSRIGRAEFELLDEKDGDQMYSKEQWLQLKCFKGVKRSGEDLVLEVDDKYLQKETEERQAIEERIKKVVTKIRKQIQYVRKVAITEDESAGMFPLRNVKITSQVLRDDYITMINKDQLEDEEYPDYPVCVLDRDLERKISDKIDREGLLVQGHYIVTDTCCERDWIDLRDIVIDKELSEQIVDKIVQEIKQKYKNDESHPIIVGMEDNGLILASRIAYRLRFPFSYMIPCNHNSEKCSEQEKFINFKPYDKIILITDAVATFQTLGNTCFHYKILDKVCNIYAILYRKPDNKKFLHRDVKILADNLTVCCSKGTIEVHDRFKCPHNGKKSCIAKNK